MKVPEQFRLRNNPILGSDSSYGNNGFFVIPHHRIVGYFYNCRVSDGMGWQHVSVSLTKTTTKTGKARKNNYGNVSNSGGVLQIRELVEKIETVERCPTWEEMCFVKDIFWNKDEAVMQIHPVESEYVSNHHYCLHLWKPDAGFQTPPADFVGTPSKQIHL